MLDLSMRLANRIQLSTDAMDSYVNAVEAAFGADVDYGQAVKFQYPIAPTTQRWAELALGSRMHRSKPVQMSL
jgi:hypothetical protein